jgi:hypothetical protein
MFTVLKTVGRFMIGNDGHVGVHCAIMLELIAIVCLAVMGSISFTANAAPPAVANSSIVSGR